MRAERIKCELKESFMVGSDWCVAVFRCKPADIKQVLIDFHGFVKDLEGVNSLHFLIRGRLDNDVVFTFRILVDSQHRQIVKSKVDYKLGTLMASSQFALDPDAGDPLAKYVAWSPDDRIAKCGAKKFAEFCDVLSRLSIVVVHMAKKKYFDSMERVEVAHIMSWMLGCTEYGLLSPTHWEIGYYDRVEDKSHQYLKEEFPKS